MEAAFDDFSFDNNPRSDIIDLNQKAQISLGPMLAETRHLMTHWYRSLIAGIPVKWTLDQKALNFEFFVNFAM